MWQLICRVLFPRTKFIEKLEERDWSNLLISLKNCTYCISHHNRALLQSSWRKYHLDWSWYLRVSHWWLSFTIWGQRSQGYSYRNSEIILFLSKRRPLATIQMPFCHISLTADFWASCIAIFLFVDKIFRTIVDKRQGTHKNHWKYANLFPVKCRL